MFRRVKLSLSTSVLTLALSVSPLAFSATLDASFSAGFDHYSDATSSSTTSVPNLIEPVAGTTSFTRALPVVEPLVVANNNIPVEPMPSAASQKKQAAVKKAAPKVPMVLPHDTSIRLRHPVNNSTYDKNLRVSLQNNYMKEAERWYNEGANVNSFDGQGRSLLYTSIITNRLQNMKFLLHRKANVNVRNEDHSTPMEAALSRGSKRIIEILVERGASVKGVMPRTRETFLQYAVTRGFEDIAVFLIDKGANVNKRYPDGKTLLHAASASGLESLVFNLLEKGAEPTAVYNAGVTPLHEAAAKGHQNIARRLIYRKADIDAATQKRWTPLHHAARFGHYNLVYYFVSQGASPFIRNSDGKTPLGLAQHMGHVQIAEYLADQGGKATRQSSATRAVASTTRTAAAKPAAAKPAAANTQQQQAQQKKWLFW